MVQSAFFLGHLDPPTQTTFATVLVVDPFARFVNPTEPRTAQRGLRMTRIPQDEQRRDQHGFTLIELLIVMSIIIIIATFAIPNITRLKRQGNEMSAIQSVRAIVAAQLQYQQTYPSNGYACSLAALGGDKSAAPSPAAAGLLATDLAGGQKAGYTFALVNCNKVTINNQDQFTSYEITAVPQKVGNTGDRGFCSDDSQQVKFDPKGGTACTQPIQ